MKYRLSFIYAVVVVLSAQQAFGRAAVSDRASRQARMMQEIGLQTSLDAIKALDARRAEEEKLEPSRKAERERLESARRSDEEKLIRQLRRAEEQKAAAKKADEERRRAEQAKLEADRRAEEELKAQAARQAEANRQAELALRKAEEEQAATAKREQALAAALESRKAQEAKKAEEIKKTAAKPANEKSPESGRKTAAPAKADSQKGELLASLPAPKRPVPELQAKESAADSPDIRNYPVVPPSEDDEPQPKAVGKDAVAYGKLLSTGPRDKPYVAFTFDDGPGQNTKQILHLFAYYRAKATFFMLGDSLQSYPELAREVAREGHLLGNHTWSHTNFYNLYDPDKLEAEIVKTYAQIQLVTGKKTYLLRIPYGVSKQWARQSAAKGEHLLVNWTYGVDTRLEKSQEEMLAEYTANLRPGAIFLFHDGGRHKPKTVWVVERLLEECRRRGLKPVTLDKMFGIDPAKFPRPAVVSPIGKNSGYAERPI